MIDARWLNKFFNFYLVLVCTASFNTFPLLTRGPCKRCCAVVKQNAPYVHTVRKYDH